MAFAIQKTAVGVAENVVRKKLWTSLVAQLLLNKHKLGGRQKAEVLYTHMLL